MGMIDALRRRVAGWVAPAGARSERLPFEPPPGSTTESGRRATPENSARYLYRLMWVDPEVRQAILDIREMDRADGRVKRIHARVARDAIKGGLMLTQPSESRVLRREWDQFQRRLQLNRVEKLKSDARGLIMEGNLPLQWVLDATGAVAAGVRMPSETILPDVDENGQFKDVRDAYWQIDALTGVTLTRFALWQMTLARYDPDNFDDMGAMGRPFLDATRTVWRKLTMTEEDLVIRRRTRAPLRVAHVLEGASEGELEEYRARVEQDQHEITTDYFMSRKGGVQPVQGDAALDQIADVVHLLDTFFAGSPLPKGMMGYTDGMARDILEDLKRDYYEEVDLLQETLSFAYATGFRLHLLLKGIAPDPSEYLVEFAERRTETLNQTVDRMLKWQALGMPPGMVFEEMGFNAADVWKRKDDEARRHNPYPSGEGSLRPNLAGGGTTGDPTVRITPGNAPKGESATSITHANRLGEHWPESEDGSGGRMHDRRAPHPAQPADG